MRKGALARSAGGLIFLIWLCSLFHSSLGRDFCAKDAVLEEFALARTSVTKAIPVSGDVSAQVEVMDSMGKMKYRHVDM